MKNSNIATSLSRAVHKVGFTLKKHSPEILVVAGVAGTVVSAVLACKATTKVGEVLDETKANVEKIHYALENPEALNGEYTEEDSKKDLVIIYAQTGVKLAKLYGPAVVLGALSITSILASNNILHKRNVALAAAYTAVDNGFKEYRSRVVERFGKELDKELKYNLKAKEVEEVTVKEDGTTEVVTKTVNTVNRSEISEYARFFDESCPNWTKNPEDNLTFLMIQQGYANKRLQLEGILFLNDVYDMLGIQKTKAGQAVGWIYDKDDPMGDNYIDFGIHDVYDEAKRAFVNGYERSILLDFNVDGTVWDKLT